MRLAGGALPTAIWRWAEDASHDSGRSSPQHARHLATSRGRAAAGNAVITVEPTTRHITIFPEGTGVFTLSATGDNLTYKWRQTGPGRDIPGLHRHQRPDRAGHLRQRDVHGSLNDDQSKPRCSRTLAGYARLFRCRVSNAAGHVDSDEWRQQHCQADYGCSGAAGVQAAYGFHQLRVVRGQRPHADFNFCGDGITVQDIFDFLAAWFAGCE